MEEKILGLISNLQAMTNDELLAYWYSGEEIRALNAETFELLDENLGEFVREMRDRTQHSTTKDALLSELQKALQDAVQHHNFWLADIDKPQEWGVFARCSWGCEQWLKWLNKFYPTETPAEQKAGIYGLSNGPEVVQPQPEQPAAKPQPQKRAEIHPTISEESKKEMECYFVPKFRGIGGGLNYFAHLCDDIQTEKSSRAFAVAACIIYNSKAMIRQRKPSTFAEWYRLMCKWWGVEYKYIQPAKLEDEKKKEKYHDIVTFV